MATFIENFSAATKKVGLLIGTGIDLALAKAKSAVGTELSSRVFTRKAIVTDVDFSGSSSLYLEKGSFVSFDVLRQLSEKDMIVAAVISKLTNRIAAFAQPQKDKYTLGFRIVPNVEADGSKDEVRVDENDTQQKTDIANLVKFLLNTGIDDPSHRPRADRYDFETFLRLIVRDRLVYNQIGIECIPTKDRKSIAYFLPVSGGSLRFVHPKAVNEASNVKGYLYDSSTGSNDDPTQKRRVAANEATEADEVMYAQVHRGQIYSVFTDEELIYRQGIPSVDLAHNGYSPGELELLINTVANHRIAELHTERFFRFGYGSNGILNIKADISDEDLQAIKRQFQRQYQGVRNSYKMPIIATKDGVEFITTSASNRDMEWGFWIEYLIKIITGVYGISPSEINFDISRGSGPTLSDSGKHNEVVLRDTRNSLLRPLLRWIESIINNEIMPRYSKDLARKYDFEFVGLDFEDQDVELGRIEKRVRTYVTVNEIREEEGKKSLGELGDIILDSVFLQNKSNIEQAARDAAAEGNDPLNSAAGAGSPDAIVDELFGDDNVESAPPAEDSPDAIIGELFGNDNSVNADSAQKSVDATLKKVARQVKKDLTKSGPKLVKVEYWSNGERENSFN